MYFADDMTAFVGQIKRWLKPKGIFFVGYQEGDVVPKTSNAHTSLLAAALRANGMSYEVCDITRQSYELLQRKRAAAEHHRPSLEAEGLKEWYDLLISQTEYAQCPYDEFKKTMSRYIFTARK